ncbi:MAG: hypothetical protein COB23_01930 [Methylophaga sp.]|nr:MAG: hypothetical protein COB23_01930 [Methylophaga sp.]
MARKNTRGATRKPVRQQRQPVSWGQGFKHLFVGMTLISVVVGSVYLQQEDTLPILHVTVEGDFVHVSKNELIKAVSPYVKGSFIDVDVANIQSAGRSLPWVKQIQVRRVWPDRLHLIVEEQTAVALWGETSLIDASGEVFTPPRNTIPPGLVKLQGPKGTNVAMSMRLVKIQQHVSLLNFKVKKLTLDQRRSWKVNFENGIEVILGRAESEQRLQRFVNVFAGGLQHFQDHIIAVDMRYTNGLSVIWKQGQKPDFNGTV